MENIVFVTPYYEPNIVGGAEISTQLIAEAFKRNAIVLTIGIEDKEEYINGVRVIRLNLGKSSQIWKKVLDNIQLNTYDAVFMNFFSLFIHGKLEKKYKIIFAKFNPNVIVFNSNSEAFGRASIWKAASHCGAKTILTLRDPLLLRKKIFNIRIDKIYTAIIRKQLKWIDSFVAPSQYMLDLYKNNNLAKADSKVIPNCVNLKFIEKSKPKRNIILYAGSIRQEKGIKTLIEAVELLSKQIPDIRLEICGKGELYEFCSQHPLIDVTPWMSRDELYGKMQEVCVTVLPSEWPEAFGRILIESISQGTLAIGSDSGGIPEVLFGDKRYLFETGNSTSLFQHLLRILKLNNDEYIGEVRDIQNKCKIYSYENYIANWNEKLLGNNEKHN